MRSLTRVALLAVLLALPAVALASGSSRVLAPNCTKAQYKPKELTLACNDGSYYLTRLKWTSWTRLKASGSGTAHVNDCTPNCAAGRFHAYRVSVTLSKPKHCPGRTHRMFGHIGEVFPGKHPGSSKRQSSPLFCPF
jgi:hypothetical protein